MHYHLYATSDRVMYFKKRRFHIDYQYRPMTRNNDPYAGRVRNALAENGSRVVGPDQGPTPPNLSSRSLFQWRREREREPGIRNFFFVSTTPRERSSAEGLRQVVKSACFRLYIYLELKYISIVVCFVASHLIFCRWPRNRRAPSTKSSDLHLVL